MTEGAGVHVLRFPFHDLPCLGAALALRPSHFRVEPQLCSPFALYSFANSVALIRLPAAS